MAEEALNGQVSAGVSRCDVACLYLLGSQGDDRFQLERLRSSSLSSFVTGELFNFFPFPHSHSFVLAVIVDWNPFPYVIFFYPAYGISRDWGPSQENNW